MMNKVTEILFHLLSDNEKIHLEQSQQLIKQNYNKYFVSIFSTLNRRLSFSNRDQIINIPKEQSGDLLIVDWTVLKLARVWLLSLIEDEQVAYFNFIDKLFEYADIHEAEALYSSLPILHFPELWVERCKDGIRNNIGSVQEAVIENNTFPYHYFDDDAWNQLVLKAFFTSKNILNIYGLFERNNVTLSNSIVDYIYERHSAKREIHPLLWLLAKDALPNRAISILENTYLNDSSEKNKAILGFVLLENKNQLDLSFFKNHSDELERLPSLTNILEAYKL